jgi:hypothetical protein
MKLVRDVLSHLHMPAYFNHYLVMYEGRLQSSWTHIITPSRNFVEVR